MRKLILTVCTIALMAGTATEAVAQRHYRHHHHWSRKAKGTAIGAGTGAIVGGVVGGGKGAVIGAAAGAGSGYLIGRHKDRKHGHVYR